MATYLIGDIHGCFLTLQELLLRIDYRPDRDRLLLTGDIVNKGPLSLETLRWAYGNRDNITAVLGNHDMVLVCKALNIRPAGRRDAVSTILEAPDGETMVHWLRTRPLLHEEPDFTLVHAGIFPGWSRDQARTQARQAESLLLEEACCEVLWSYQRRDLLGWRDDLTEPDQIQFALQAFTRMRVLTPDLRMELDFTDEPEKCPPPLRSWYDFDIFPGETTPIFFGHWSAVGFRRIGPAPGRVICLDSSCVYGGSLTAYRLEDHQAFHVPCRDAI